jgi:hypothetical protein
VLDEPEIEFNTEDAKKNYWLFKNSSKYTS